MRISTHRICFAHFTPKQFPWAFPLIEHSPGHFTPKQFPWAFPLIEHSPDISSSDNFHANFHSSNISRTFYCRTISLGIFTLRTYFNPRQFPWSLTLIEHYRDISLPGSFPWEFPLIEHYPDMLPSGQFPWEFPPRTFPLPIVVLASWASQPVGFLFWLGAGTGAAIRRRDKMKLAWTRGNNNISKQALRWTPQGHVHQ